MIIQSIPTYLVHGILIEKNAYFNSGQELESTGFSEWGDGFPIKGRERNCAVFKPSLQVLHNGGCDWKYGFLCEREL